MGRVHLVGAQPEQPKRVMHCPECKAPTPPYDWHVNGGNLGSIGSIVYMTAFCGAPLAGEDPETGKRCGCILGVTVVAYQPSQNPADIAAMEKAMRGGTPS